MEDFAHMETKRANYDYWADFKLALRAPFQKPYHTRPITKNIPSYGPQIVYQGITTSGPK